MRSKLFLGFCALVTASLPLPAMSIPSGFDYKANPGDYHALPNLDLPNRTLPRAFDFPIKTKVQSDTSITTNSIRTDAFVNNLPAIPNGITLDDIPRIRGEYSQALKAWGESITECFNSKPLLIRESSGSPVLIDGQEGTIVTNANGRAVCK